MLQLAAVLADCQLPYASGSWKEARFSLRDLNVSEVVGTASR